MRKKSLGVNAVLNGIKTLVSIAFPLITLPYISRVLQVENVGNYNYSFSIVNYFALIAGFGVSTYAVREGTKYRDNYNDFSSFASEVFSVNILSTLLAYVLLAFTVVILPGLSAYRTIIGILCISIACSTIGCEWMFSVYEDYLYITIRSILFQLLSLALLFLLVKTREDVSKYALVTVISSSGASLVNYLSRQKYARIRIRFSSDLTRHLKPMLLLFTANVATVIYVNSDVTMLGALVGTYYVGLYSVATKVYSLVKQLLSAIIIVSVPRLSAYIAGRQIKEYNTTASVIFHSLLSLVVPAVVGIIMLAPDIVLFLSDDTFLESAKALRIISIALIFCIFSWFYTSCVLIPNKQEKHILKATFAAALVNIAANLLLIPHFQEKAAAFTTMLAELCSLIICYLYGKRFVSFKLNKWDLLSVLTGCGAIVAVCLLNGGSERPLLFRLLIPVAESAAAYALILGLMKNTLYVHLASKVSKKLRKPA